MVDNIEQLKKNNELFANSLTYKIIGKANFLKLLRKWGYDGVYINNYTKVIEKYLKDYENKLNIHLQNLNK